jgi:hypothetical protein
VEVRLLRVGGAEMLHWRGVVVSVEEQG